MTSFIYMQIKKEERRENLSTWLVKFKDFNLSFNKSATSRKLAEKLCKLISEICAHCTQANAFSSQRY